MPSRLSVLSQAVMHALESRVLLSDAARISDFVAGPESSLSAPSIGSVNGKLLFGAVDPDAGLELFISDGTTGGTKLLKDINPGPSSSDVSEFVPGPNGVAYFSASTGTHAQVWRTDGTAAGTFALTSFTSTATPITYVNNRLLIKVLGGIGEDSTLVSSDGATPGNGATLLTGTLTHLGDVNNVAIFGGENDTNGNPQIFRSNGTAGGSSLLTNAQWGLSNETVVFNGALYFQGATDSSGMELFGTNGLSNGTAPAANINPGSAASNPHDFTISGGQMYFVANGGAGGEQIYRANATTITPITTLAGTSNDNAIDRLADVNGTIFFSYSANGGFPVLYKLAGNTTPTAITAGESLHGVFENVAVGSTYFFSGLGTVDNKIRLYESDGTSVKFTGGDQGTGASFLTKVGDKLFFEAEDDAHGSELHVLTDGDSLPPFSVRIKIFPNKKGHTSEINESESLVFQAVTSGQTVNKYYWDFGDGKLIYMGKSFKPLHDYPDNFASPTVNVRVKVQAQDGKFYNTSIPLTVKNVKPKIKLTIPPVFTTYAPMPFFGSVVDPDVTSGKMKSIDVEWEDGEHYTLPIDKTGVFHGVKVFTEAPDTGDDLTIRANDGDAEGRKKVTVLLTAVSTFLPEDPIGKALGLLGTYIGGTSGNDRIQIKPRDLTEPESDMVVIMGLTNLVIAADSYFPPITIYAGDGADRVDIDPTLTHKFKIYGGNGNDTLRGGAGRDTIYGEGGRDSIDGRGGKNKVKQ